MAEPVVTDESATEEAGSVPVVQPTHDDGKKQEPRQFLERARRDLSEDELATPAARRFLIAEIERLDQNCNELRKIEKLYSDLRVSEARLQERNKSNRWNEVLSFVAASIGAAGIGAAPSYLTAVNLYSVGIVITACSVILIAVGILSRVFK